MKKEERILLSTCDKLPIDTLIYTPDTSPIAIVQIAHGMAEYKERYDDFCTYLANQGYIVIINDHRGHGKSVLSKEDLGYFYDETSNYIVDDLYLVNQTIHLQYPTLPIILFGHSMGSIVVRKYTQKYENTISGLIVCGSPSQNALAPLGLTLAKLIKVMKGDRFRCPILQKLSFLGYNKNIQDPISKNAWLSVNTENVIKYDQDELCGFNFTVNGYINLYQMMIDIYDPKKWHPGNTTLPILFIAGEKDPVIMNPKAWQKAQDFLINTGYKNISNHLYPSLRHEILNEEQKETIYQDIDQWIQSNLLMD